MTSNPGDRVQPRNEAIRTRRTARLLLRVPTSQDLAFHTALFVRQEMIAHRPHPIPDSPEVSASKLARMIAHWEEHGFGRWAVEREGEVIGFCGLTLKAEANGLNLSYHLHPDWWGGGYASEAVAETLFVAFGELDAPQVAGLVRPVNVASRRVLERAGFAEDATIDLDGAPTIRMIRRR